MFKRRARFGVGALALATFASLLATFVASPASAATVVTTQLSPQTGFVDTNDQVPDVELAVGNSVVIQIDNESIKLSGLDPSTGTSYSGTIDGNLWPQVNCSGTNEVSRYADPQVFWSPNNKRFFFSVMQSLYDCATGGGGFQILYGFSKSSSPAGIGSSDWCSYQYADPSDAEPDFDRLGDSTKFTLISFNTLGDPSNPKLFWAQKPANGTITTCPTGFNTGAFSGITLPADVNGNTTPHGLVPARGVDPKAYGVVVAPYQTSHTYYPAHGSSLAWFKVTDDGTGNAVMGSIHHVNLSSSYDGCGPTYTGCGKISDGTYPSGSHSGQRAYIDGTAQFDGRFSAAWLAYDPTLADYAVWTAHEVQDGNGTAGDVRMYEIQADPTVTSPVQDITVSCVGSVGATCSDYNGSVAPNRFYVLHLPEILTSGGDGMVMTYAESTSSEYPQIMMVSNSAHGSLSSPTLMKSSNGPNVQYATGYCPEFCRFGDYSSAVPGETSQVIPSVYLENEWTDTMPSTSGPNNDRTYIWEAKP